jgi:hypothetical protein
MPDIGQLVGNSAVQGALTKAWDDSFQPNGAVTEQGGWIYWNPQSGEIQTRFAAAGDRSSLEALDSPDAVPGFLVVGTFHTHPNTPSEGYKIEPSAGDKWFGLLRGVPGLVVTEYGVYGFGPSTRGDDTWTPGFPH